jgi:undecaprenyl-diphosphatase
MPDLMKAGILGIIEGLTEFLPISSTGHMVIAMPWLGIDADVPPWHAFLYFIQIGAILAVLVAFGARLAHLLLQSPATGWRDHLLVKLAVASIPAAVIGLPLSKWAEAHLETPPVVAIALIVGAFVMEAIERGRPTVRTDDVSEITMRQALLIGLAQCVSIVPGTSRAMATIMGGLLVGLSLSAATEFSFYLAIPTLLGAGLLKVVKYRSEIHGGETMLLAVGFVTAFVVALLVVRAFLAFVRTHRLRPFAIYRVLLGLVVLVWWWGR